MEHSSTYLLCLFYCQNEKARFQLQPTKQQQQLQQEQKEQQLQPVRQVNSEATKPTTAKAITSPTQRTSLYAFAG